MRSNNSWLVALAAGFLVQECPATQDTVKWVLHDFRRPAANNSEFEKYHLGATYNNQETICPGASIQVSTIDSGFGGVAKIATKNTVQFWNHAFCSGVLFPIDPAWKFNNDIRSIKEIRFKTRSSSMSRVKVSFDGPASPFSSAGYELSADAVLGGRQGWRWSVIPIPEFAYSNIPENLRSGDSGDVVGVYLPDSIGNMVRSSVRLNLSAFRGEYLNDDFKGIAAYDDDSVNILKNVRAIKLQFQNSDRTILIDSVVLVGVSPTWPRVNGKTCQGVSALLDDFSAAKPDPTRNLLGGAWWAISDTDSFRPQSIATGKSMIESGNGGWVPSPELGAASLVADLNRIDPDAHPDAGWASLFTNVPAGALENLKAISMKIGAGGGDGFPFDSSRIMGVVFRAIGPGFADSLVYEARIPFRQIRSTPDDSSICLDLSELRQPAWYTGIHGIKRVSPKDILRFSWSLVLQDPAATTASTSRIDLKEVRLWGLEPTSSIGGGGAQRKRQEIGVRNRDGIRLSYSVPGASAVVRIVRMDGSTASVFTGPATVSDMPLPNRLGRGTYAIEVVGAGERRAARFAVP